MSKKVLILGASGMLGSMLCDYFAKQAGFELSATFRDLKLKEKSESFAKIKCLQFDGEDSLSLQKLNLPHYDWVINAIGIIKPYIKDDDSKTVECAIKINSLLPHALAGAVKNTDTKIIQIATDCVFSGKEEKYDENAPYDALDVYGKTKNLGEVKADNFYNIRCSIIGPEKKGKLSLLEWFLGQKQNAGVKGFKNHFWNGITTLHFAHICKGIIEQNLKLQAMQHIVPKDILSKAAMLEIFSLYYKRNDIKITSTDADIAIDRTLSTIYPKLNTQIWQSANYDTPPSIEQMIKELSQYK
ncbi:MAG TPA: SDR family oxidoreductase [Elusimicrobiales bacterium]|nr:SDR family oxidoreductase [Elusimicrobiales bacterium]